MHRMHISTNYVSSVIIWKSEITWICKELNKPKQGGIKGNGEVYLHVKQVYKTFRHASKYNQDIYTKILNIFLADSLLSCVKIKIKVCIKKKQNVSLFCKNKGLSPTKLKQL
jgi:hypothetical protein